MILALLLAGGAVASYLCGGVNGAIIMSRLLHHDDIRKRGSGNPGFTNYKRVYGGVSAWVVFVLDLLKTVIPVLAFFLLFGAFSPVAVLGAQFGAAYAGFFAMLGHAFPVYYRFKGGKAFTAGAATIWFVDWRMALIAAAVFLILLFTVHIMSLSSITAAAVCPIALACLGTQMWVLVLSILSAALLIARHHKNIERLLNHTETKFYFRKKKST